MFIDEMLVFLASLRFTYFAPLVLALGEGDAAGEGLGLGVLAGAPSVAPLGETAVDGEGLAVVGEFELSTGSVAQPAANTSEAIVRSSSAVRLIMSMFGVLISFSLISTRLKSGMIIARPPISSNGCSHRSFAWIAAWSAPKPSFSKTACTINERVANFRMALMQFRVQALACVRPKAATCRLDSELLALFSQQRIRIDVGAFPVTPGIGDDGD